jgi:hypothetical protein
MIIKLTRTDKDDYRSIGTFEFGGNLFYSLEDTDRGLKQDMPLAGILAIKVKNYTAIPYGKYEIAMTYSNRFKKVMPLLMNVPGFDGIRIHSGNTEADTEGCILLGTTRNNTMVLYSRIAIRKFTEWLTEIIKTEKVWIEIVK